MDERLFVAATPEEAIAKRAVFLALRRDGFTLPKGRKLTVAEWVRHWLWKTAKPKIDPNTFYRSYRQKCEDYIIPYFTHVKLAELTEEDIEAWHQQLRARTSRRGTPLSPSTITTAHRILSASLNAAVARRRLPHNPCTLVHPPKVRRAEPEPPSADEVRQILAACQGRPGGARWVLAICTGLRQGEALGLRWRDVRLAPPASVTVRQSLARVDGKSVFKEPKSAKSRRTVPLPAIAVVLLRAHRDAQAVVGLRDGLVFTDPAGGPLLARADWDSWHDLLDSLGLPHYRPHLVRHGFATTLLEGGADPRLVQDLMGHSTTALLQVYQHVRPVMHEQARSMLDQAFGGEPR
jgi:integrase